MPGERVLDDGKAETGATGLARAAAIDAVEALGEPRHVLRRDSQAGVLDRKARALGAVAPDQPDFASSRRIANRPADEIAEAPPDFRLHAAHLPLRVAPHRAPV